MPKHTIHTIGIRYNTSIIIALILIVLLAVSTMQVIQFMSIKSRIRNNPLISYRVNSASQQNNANQGTQGAMPASLDNMPSMIGFC
ncbi:hypothetical protein HYU06_02130 [Candidatus Woesearchaeota archaeon]|nr:hypothetical protein [Candidatus Woesearchaeota archaeon]